MELETALEAVRGRGGAEGLERVLGRYNEKNRATFKFDPADEDKRKKLCEGILHILEKDTKTSCQVACLEALRILSRDKKVLVPVTTKENMQILMRLAKLDMTEDSLEDVSNFPIIVEALKCLCNIVFNSAIAQKLSLELNLAAMLCNLLKKCKDQQFVDDIKCFDLRLLFLLSLLHTEIRSQLHHELQGLQVLTQALESSFSIRWTDKYKAAEEHDGSPLSLQETDCAIEALKALFNVTLDSWNVHSENESHQFRYMAAILRHCLLTVGPTEDKTEELHSNAINLLSNIPVSCLDVLINPSTQEETVLKYNGMNMDAIQVLLDFMEKRIDKGSSYREGLTPVLSLLTECCRAHRNIRKFIKAQVLPPLRDVSNRPEVGTTVRNKLVRLMTHVDLGVKQIAAEFLFVLCKERVDNLLKYTGYGNAAGLLAARGLLAGGRGDHWYSDDEDTDTEEYKSAKPKLSQRHMLKNVQIPASFGPPIGKSPGVHINLITGHVEEPMPNPMDEMTEEQKEYEAMKLVNMFDKLSRDEVIKPMGVRPDGTMTPLEETICQYQTNEQDSSDSD
ncbi:synembryn-B isoform X2 [Chelonia mydas]|uniref:synembryn-B isoform X2 n=1 Tax=Chelonia mydas TaxID=8469 RepID=UPI0018A203BF|nr:synembryn-B isoform X2 [Chelonia mydas]